MIQANALTQEKEIELAALFERPRLKEGVELHPFDTGVTEPVYLVHLSNGQRMQISTYLYAVLSRLDGQHTLQDLARELTEQHGQQVTAQEVLWILREKVYPQGLLAGSNVPFPEPSPTGLSILQMQVRIPVLSAQRARRLTQPLQHLFNPYVAGLIFALVVLVHGLTYYQLGKGINLLKPRAALSMLVDHPTWLLFIYLIMMLSSWIHEFGHLAACRRFDCQHGAMGMGIYSYFHFVLYVETNDAWRLPRLQRVVIDLGGIYFQFLVTLVFYLIYLGTGNDLFLWAIVFADSSILNNLNPMFKYDGYWALSDLAGVPNLHQRVGDQLRRLLPGRARGTSPFLQNQPLAQAALWLYSLFFVLYFAYFGWLMMALLPNLLPLYPEMFRTAVETAGGAFGRGDWGGGLQALLRPAMPTLLLFGVVFFAWRGVRAVWGWRTKLAGLLRSVPQWRFTRRYLKPAWRNLTDQLGRSFLGLLSVTVGVAIIVALLNLTQLIGDSVLGDARGRLHADLQVDLSNWPPADLTFFEELQAEGLVATYTPMQQRQVQIRHGEKRGLVTLVAVEPGVYPLYGKIPLLNGAGDGASLLNGGSGQAILTSNVVQRLGLQMGDQVLLVGDGSQTARVAGSTPPLSAVPFALDTRTIFGYLLLDQQSAAEVLGKPVEPASHVLLRLTNEENLEIVEARIAAHTALWETLSYRQVATRTGDRLYTINQLLRYVGLLSLLVGGVGVAHTVQVSFDRRRSELAVLKALGFRGRQLFALLSIEALWIGLLGGLIGVSLGLLVGWGSTQLAEGILLQPLQFRVYPLALVAGLVTGIVTVLIFSVLPALHASQVRPAALLRHEGGERHEPGRRWQTILALLLLVIATGLMAGAVLGSLSQGLAFAGGLFVVCGGLVLLLRGLLGLVGRLPRLRSPILGLALTNLSRQRARAATALLAFTVGVFAVGAIILLSENARFAMRQIWGKAIAYDVLIFLPRGQEATVIAQESAELDGVVAVAVGNTSRVQLTEMNGMPAGPLLETYQEAAKEAGVLGMLESVDGRDLAAGLPDKQLNSGRMLAPEDAGRPVTVISSAIAEALPVTLGDRLTFLVENGGDTLTLEVVGVYRDLGWSVGGSGLFTSIETLAAVDDAPAAILRLQTQPGAEDAVSRIVSQRYPAAFVLDSRELFYSFDFLFDSFSVFPTLVASLALLAGVVIIANNVALALLERRDEVGILKAVGVRRGRVLALLLLENGVLGLISGSLGILLAMLATYLLTTQGLLGEAVEPTFGLTPIASALMGTVVIVLLATAVTSWRAVGARPLAVLRNE